eukprot:765947-Hanusia_phi.AAC.1
MNRLQQVKVQVVRQTRSRIRTNVREEEDGEKRDSTLMKRGAVFVASKMASAAMNCLLSRHPGPLQGAENSRG